MIDIHSHVLYGVDDGCKNLTESLDVLEALKEIGFDDIIVTPHYIINSGNEKINYDYSKEENLEKIEKLKTKLEKNNIDINLYLGNEIFIDSKMIELLDNKTISTINNTKCILLELPFYNKIINVSDILHEIKLKGYTPIIAHPERYVYFQKDYHLVDELKKEGVLFQCNYFSILGYYNKESKKLFKYMLKKKYVDFLGTDIHSRKQIRIVNKMDKIERKIIKLTGKEFYDNIEKNCYKLIGKSK